MKARCNGAYVGNGGVAHSVAVDYFYNTASPGPGDLDQNILSLNIQGNGAVAKDPDQASYLCGEPMTLTATPEPGWAFTGWSGDLSGSNNAESLTISGNHVVIATFTEVTTYTLTLNPSGNGSVSGTPNLPQ